MTSEYRQKKSGKTGSSRSGQNASAANAYNQFVRYELAPDQVQACKAWEVTPDMVWDMLEKLIEANYAIALRWDDYTHCYACWVAAKKGHVDHDGFTLSGRGSTAWKAAKQVLYKHYVCLQEVWPIGDVTNRQLEIDD